MIPSFTTTKRIRRSGRTVTVRIQGDVFYVVRPDGRRGARSAAGFERVAGPFALNDPRFIQS